MSFRRPLLTIGLVLIMGTSFVVPVGSFAAEETCDCWCGSKQGAVSYAQGSDSKIPVSDCRAFCAKDYPGYQMAVCATSSAQLPTQNITCFTSTQCADQEGDFDEKFQPPECMSGERYCYPDASKAAKVTLSTSIGGLSVTGDLGEYIARAYSWLLGVSTTIAIVFMMVAGIRWSLGGLSAEQVGKAKTTIQNAVVGLVLLLATYLILQTVNPQLLKLQVPRFPMIRTIGLVTADTSCGYLEGTIPGGLCFPGSPFSTCSPAGEKHGKPYTIDGESNGSACGSVGKVVKDWQGNDMPDGTTCTYSWCEDKNEKCFASSGGRGDCMACGDVVGNQIFIEPSSSVCAQLSLKEETGTVSRTLTTRVRNWWPDVTFRELNVTVPIINQCFWTRNGSMTNGTRDVTDLITGTGVCAMLQIDCREIDECEDYDMIPKVVNKNETEQLEAIRNHGDAGGLAGLVGSTGDLSLSSICNADPCKVSRDGYTRCYSEQPEARLTGSFTALVSLQGNDCVTKNVR